MGNVPIVPTRTLCGLQTRSLRMLQVLTLVERYACLDAPVLLQGATGTGKELVARALHALGPRSRQPIVVVDCGALPESLLESELFGHERGAFTGADRAYTGRIQAAAGGTLFLDEVNSVSLAMQTKLLRFLERKEIYRMGQAHPIPVDVRVISASNVPLRKLVESGRMRADFYYRLNVLGIELPALAERPDDIPLLVRQFLATDDIAKASGVTDVSGDVMAELQRQPWPGNVRQLFNVLRRAVADCEDRSSLHRLPADLEAPNGPAAAAEEPASGASFRSWMREQERRYLADLVRRYQTIRQQAAASALPERTLYRKIRRLRLPTASRHRERHAAGGSLTS